MAQRPHEFRKIRPEPMGDRAYVQLRDALFAGRFEPGGNLPLRTLAENFGTSITPVRDAVSRLIAQGVLELGPRNSARVPELGSDQLSQLTIVRCELEGLAAQEAVKASAPGVADALAATLAQMRGLIREGDFSRYLGVHRAFHFEIYAAAGVPLLQEMIENLWLRCGPVLSFVVPEYVTSLKGTDHHTAVVDAFRRGDGATARAEIVADIEEASAYLLSLTDEAGTIRRLAGRDAALRGPRAVGLAGRARRGDARAMDQHDDIRPGEEAVALPAATDAAVYFIGRISTPWTERRDCPRQGRADGPLCRIEVFAPWDAALDGIAAFPRIEVLYWLDRARRDLVRQSPRDGALRGTFSLRSPVRPNPIGTQMVDLVEVSGATLTVRGLDCLDGTPLIDLKPDRCHHGPATVAGA